jgi:Zn-dependent peptidase ImmA (M78 family)
MLTDSECSRLAEAVAKLGKEVIGLTGPVDADKWCDRAGVQLCSFDQDIEGRYSHDPQPTIFLRDAQSPTCRNFTLAHELGHHLLEDCRRKSALRLVLGDYGVKLLSLLTPASHVEELVCDSIAATLLLSRLVIDD